MILYSKRKVEHLCWKSKKKKKIQFYHKSVKENAFGQHSLNAF